MEILVLTILGGISGLLVSKSSLNKGWNFLLGVLGALMVGSLLIDFAVFGLLLAMEGAVVIIHIGGSLNRLSQN